MRALAVEEYRVLDDSFEKIELSEEPVAERLVADGLMTENECREDDAADPDGYEWVWATYENTAVGDRAFRVHRAYLASIGAR